MDTLDTKAFIEQQLMSAGVFYRTKHHDFALACPFHQHSGKQQKLEIHFDGRMAKCWVCGPKPGGWDSYAEIMGLKKLPASTAFAYQNVERQIDNVQRVIKVHAKLPPDVEPFEEEYRGLSPEFMARFGSKKWYDPKSKAWRVLWPVDHNGNTIGYVAGRLDDRTTPKYRNGPEGVFQSRRAVWPIDDAAIKDVLVLTEGPFSALRLLANKIPAAAILGTGAWHSNKLSVIQQRPTPVRGIVIAMDGDDAGWECTKVIYREAKARFSRVEIFECPVDKDPGDMSAKFIKQLRGLVRSIENDLNQ
jgi:hypothetical protein